jgi:ketosteroid isomerase-like protein
VPEQNVEVLRRAVDAFNARDIDRFLSYFHPDIKLHSAFSAIGGAEYHGHDGLRKLFRDFEQAWGDEIHVESKAYFDLGDRTISSYVIHGRGLHSGVDVDLPSALVAGWRDGLIAYLKAFAHREDAFAELGVAEDELDPIAP